MTANLSGRARQLFGFGFVLVLLFAGFSIAAPNFASFGNVSAMLHAMGPITAASCGLAIVVLAGKIDISIGSIAFLSASVGGVAMQDYGLHPLPGFAIILVLGAALGALNGFVVVVMGVNSLIATLGTMIAFRGVGLVLTDARVIPLDESVRWLGNFAIGPVFVDTIVVGLVFLAVHHLHRNTTYGRQVVAIGNGEETARRVGIHTDRNVFLAFVVSGLLASVAACSAFIQVGSISGFLGKGMEFNAIAVIVVGGISLAGGRGRILPGVLLGALAFQMIANGLNQIGANPYVYQLTTGIVIFVAMYLDALKTSARLPVRT